MGQFSTFTGRYENQHRVQGQARMGCNTSQFILGPGLGDGWAGPGYSSDQHELGVGQAWWNQAVEPISKCKSETGHARLGSNIHQQTQDPRLGVSLLKELWRSPLVPLFSRGWTLELRLAEVQLGRAAEITSLHARWVWGTGRQSQATASTGLCKCQDKCQLAESCLRHLLASARIGYKSCQTGLRGLETARSRAGVSLAGKLWVLPCWVIAPTSVRESQRRGWASPVGTCGLGVGWDWQS